MQLLGKVDASTVLISLSGLKYSANKLRGGVVVYSTSSVFNISIKETINEIFTSHKLCFPHNGVLTLTPIDKSIRKNNNSSVNLGIKVPSPSPLFY